MPRPVKGSGVVVVSIARKQRLVGVPVHSRCIQYEAPRLGCRYLLPILPPNLAGHLADVPDGETVAMLLDSTWMGHAPT